MKRLRLNKYYLNGTVLMLVAVALIGVALFTNRGDISTAALIIAGFASFLLGIFFFTYSGGEIDEKDFVSLLPVQNCINICRIAGDLGISGPAWVLPGSAKGGDPVQFNPIGTFRMPPSEDDRSFRITPPYGMRTGPSGLPLYRQLAQRYAWNRPSDPVQVALSIKEVGEDVYRLAGQVDADFDQNLFTVRLRDFRYIEGCLVVQKDASPACCRMHPCPVCSLMMCMIAGSLRVPCMIDQAEADPTDGTLTVMVRILPADATETHV